MGDFVGPYSATLSGVEETGKAASAALGPIKGIVGLVQRRKEREQKERQMEEQTRQFGLEFGLEQQLASRTMASQDEEMRRKRRLRRLLAGG